MVVLAGLVAGIISEFWNMNKADLTEGVAHKWKWLHFS